MEEAWELAVVSTDAKALYDFLVASKEATLGTRLGDFACSYLGLPKGEYGQALLAIQGLAFRVNQAINSIDLPQAERNEIFKYFSPFLPLLNYTSYSQNMQWARQQFIQDAHVGKLMILDAVMAGKIGHAPELNDINGLVLSIEEVIEVFRSSDLPINLRNAILKRLLQIQSSLSNYEVFGAQSVVDETAKIIGMISMYNQAHPKAAVNKTDAVTVFREYSKKIATGISKARNLVEDIQFLTDAGVEAVGTNLEDMSDRA